jgi:hypothetical protein
MRLNKHKQQYLIYILIFCVVLAALGGFYLGKMINEKESIVVAPVESND